MYQLLQQQASVAWLRGKKKKTPVWEMLEDPFQRHARPLLAPKFLAELRGTCRSALLSCLLYQIIPMQVIELSHP